MQARFHGCAGLLVHLAGAASGQIGGGGGNGEIHKNVLVIVLDDLGTDKLSFYGEMPPNCQYWDCTCAGQPCSCGPPPCYCNTIQHGCVEPHPSTPNLDAL